VKQEHEHAIRDLRSAQDYIRGLVRGVDQRIDRLAAEVATEHEPPPEPVRIAPILKPLSEPPRPIEPPMPKVAASQAPIPPTPVSVPLPEPAQNLPEPEPIPTERSETPEDSDSFELTFGRVWLVRIGIVILLTGLVFLGNLAYQHIVPRLGPAAKLSLIVLAGGALGGIGLWLERARESMRNYARVLIGGACAAIYYAAYAAHFVQPLKVIENPIIGGTILLGLAGGIGWMAHRRKSETLAGFAVLLSYYTSGLNPIGGFTLFSSLLLTATAVFFLLKHRWVRLSFLSLLGTYLSYAWSHSFAAFPRPAEGSLALPIMFLGGYWLLFTLGTFLSRKDVMSAASRVPFLTLNNGAFFTLCSLELYRHASTEFWILSLSFGAVLLGLSWLARWRNSEDHALEGALFVQGLALTTLGFATKLTGYQFALTLAAQSVVLLFTGTRQRILRNTASIASVCGAAWFALQGLVTKTPFAGPTVGIVILVLCFDAWIFRRRNRGDDAERSDPIAMALALVAMALVISWSSQMAGWPSQAHWLAAGSVACAALPCVLRFRELSLAGQVLFPVASVLWLNNLVLHSSMVSATSGSLVGVGALLSIWWTHQRQLPLGDQLRLILESTTALCAGVVAWIWTSHRFEGASLMIAASLVAPAWIALALAGRARMLALAGIGFSGISIVQFAFHQHSTSWELALLPIVHVLAVAWLAGIAIRRFSLGEETVTRDVRRIAIVVAGLMSMLWIFRHIPNAWQSLFFATIGAAASLAGATRRVRELSITGAILGGIAWVLAVFDFQTAPTWQQIAAIILFPAACRVARKYFPQDPTHQFIPQMSWATMAGITIWLLRWTALHDKLMSLTIIWTLLALGFSAIGLILRDRHYRLGGLILLSLSVGRVFFVDVWAFDPVYRILSFIVLGVVLLLVGYFYNRFEEKLRRWI
jgi:uncharacterized membrane protein